MHVELKGLWLQEAIVDDKFALGKVHIVVNPADACTKALRGERIRELRRLAHVFLCRSEDAMGVAPENWSLSQLNTRSSGGKSVITSVLNNRTRLDLEVRVDFTCPVLQSVSPQSVRHRLDATSHSSQSATAKCLHSTLDKTGTHHHTIFDQLGCKEGVRRSDNTTRRLRTKEHEKNNDKQSQQPSEKFRWR